MFAGQDTAETAAEEITAPETTTRSAETLQDYVRLRAQVANCLEELASIDEGIGQPARAARSRAVRESLLAQRFTLLVLGEFKRGKSSLINRLLGGQDVLPVGAAPTTAVLTRVTYGEEPTARIVLEDGTERSVDLARLAEEITLVQSDEGTNQLRHAGIVRAEVTLPVALCRDGVDLVDSPGLGEHRTRTEVTYEALPAADAVVFVSDAAQLGSEDEGFVQSKLAREGINNVFFVINKWDRVYNETEDPEAEIQALRRRAWALFVPEPKVTYNGQDLQANRIYPLSCRPNLAPEEEQAAVSALFDTFRSDLEAFLVRESGRVALDRAIIRARAQIAETVAGLRARGPALGAELSEFERRVAAAEEALRKVEGPRQAIRNAIAAKRQEVRREVRSRTEKELPPIAVKIKEEFAKREYRPKGQIGQRVWEGLQDPFRRQKIRDELRLQVREIAAAQLDPWATGLNKYVETQVTALLKSVESQAGQIEATFQEATRIIGGLDATPDSPEQEQADLLNRGLAVGLGVLLRDPFLIATGGMYGIKGLSRTMLYQLGGVIIVASLGLPILPVLVAGAVIASVQGSEELLETLKQQALDEVLKKLEELRTTGIADLETRATMPLDACGVAIEQAIEARIADHREQITALRAQYGTARDETSQERSRIEAAQAAVAAVAIRLETLVQPAIG